MQPYRQKGLLPWTRPPKKKKEKRLFPQGTTLHTFPQGTKSFWKKLMKKRRPRTQPLLRPMFSTVIMTAGLSIVMQMTRPPHGIGRDHNGNVLALRANAEVRANKEVKANSKRVVQELRQAFSLDTLERKVVRRVKPLHLSLRLAQGVPPPPQLPHGRLRRPVNAWPQQVLQHLLLWPAVLYGPVLRHLHHYLVVLFVPVLRHLLLMLLLLLPLLPRLSGRLHLGERHRHSRDLGDHLRHRAWNQHRPGDLEVPISGTVEGRLLLGPGPAIRHREQQEEFGATPPGHK